MGKKSNKSKSKKTSGGGNLSSLVSKVSKQILGATPSFQAPVQDFEQAYTPELQAEDTAQSKALFEPQFNERVGNLLEDLKTTESIESVSYERTLRRARFSMAAQGGAIGTERAMNDQDILDRQKSEQDARLKASERTIGTQRMQESGYRSVTNSPQEGSLVRELKANTAEQELWYKDQRAKRYYNDASKYYQTPTGTSLTGSKM